MVGVHVRRINDSKLAIEFPYDQILVERIKGMPQRRWSKKYKQWEFRPSLENIKYLEKWFPEAEWAQDTLQFIEDATERKRKRDTTAEAKATEEFDFSLLDGVPFKMPPLGHQKCALLLGRDMPCFAYLMDQGTGKTKVVIDDAAHNFRQGLIDGMIVFAPNSVKSNWVDPDDTYSKTCDPGDMDEITKHMADDIIFNKGCWVSAPTKQAKVAYRKFRERWGEEQTLHVMVVNIEAMHVKRVYAEVLAFSLAHRCMAICDEATRIKNRTAKRTKNAIKIRDGCVLARIMTGTPLIKSPLDAFAQFRFLDEDILGFSSYYSFQHHFAVMGGFNGYQVLFYKNIEELSAKIDAVSYRVLKEDCLELPPKKYIRRSVTLSRLQLDAYHDMREHSIVNLSKYGDGEEGIVNATIVLTQLMRLQQITGGYLPQLDDAGDTIGHVEIIPPDKNPKFKEIMDIIGESGEQKVVIWCRFRKEIEGICELLRKKEIGYLEFHGGVSTTDRRNVRKQFFSDDVYKVMVANADAGGIGIDEFKIASIAIYMSNSYSTENRVQSEDRQHRIGSEMHDLITYYDIVAEKTVDAKVISCLRKNVEMSSSIMKDGWREWI